VTVQNDGDRPGMLYGALIAVHPDRADQTKEFTFQLLPSERIHGMPINLGAPTYVSLPFEDRWQGASNILAVFLGRILDTQSAINKGVAQCSLVLLFKGPMNSPGVERDVSCASLVHIAPEAAPKP
jgi:hypothetical protein